MRTGRVWWERARRLLIGLEPSPTPDTPKWSWRVAAALLVVLALIVAGFVVDSSVPLVLQ